MGSSVTVCVVVTFGAGVEHLPCHLREAHLFSTLFRWIVGEVWLLLEYRAMVPFPPCYRLTPEIRRGLRRDA